MKYLARLFLIVGLLCIVFSPLCCRHVRDGLHPPTDDHSSEVAGNGLFSREFEFFLAVIGFGVFALCLGEFLRSRSRDSSARESEHLMWKHIRCCSACGKPLCRKECNRTKQFRFIPRLACPECGAYAEWSCAITLASGIVLILTPFIAGMLLNPLPDLVIAIGFFSVPIGTCFVVLGLWDHDRQFASVKRYVSSRNERTCDSEGK